MEHIIDFSYKEKGKDALMHRKHSHNNCYEMLQIWSGEGVVMVKEKLYPIKSGALFFINGMDIHCSAPKAEADYVRSKILIAADFMDRMAELTQSFSIIQDLFIQTGGMCIELAPDQAAFIDAELLKIRDSLAQASPYTNVTVSTALLQIYAYAHAHKNRVNPALSNKISQVMQYINRNIGRKLTLDELCGHVHTSKYHLCHLFKETTHMSIQDYLLLRRISIAKKKLIYTDAPISDIAISTGFSSFSYFSKMFKACEGVTPGAFRKHREL